jgi:hypothetical protein
MIVCALLRIAHRTRVRVTLDDALVKRHRCGGALLVRRDIRFTRYLRCGARRRLSRDRPQILV